MDPFEYFKDILFVNCLPDLSNSIRDKSASHQFLRSKFVGIDPAIVLGMKSRDALSAEELQTLRQLYEDCESLVENAADIMFRPLNEKMSELSSAITVFEHNKVRFGFPDGRIL